MRPSPVSVLQDLLDSFRIAALTNREAGTYFEQLTVAYLRTEPAYKELYGEVLTWADWAERRATEAGAVV